MVMTEALRVIMSFVVFPLEHADGFTNKELSKIVALGRKVNKQHPGLICTADGKFSLDMCKEGEMYVPLVYHKGEPVIFFSIPQTTRSVHTPQIYEVDPYDGKVSTE